jgi:cardiolipin synthase
VLIDDWGSKRWLSTLVPRLEKAGVEVHAVLPVSWFRRSAARFDLRNHRKITVIDGRIGYVGSQNIVSAVFKEGITYEELVVRATGPVVLQFQAVFLTDWFLETSEDLLHGDLFPDPERPGSAPAQALPSGPGYPVDNTHRLMVALLHAARQRVVITTPYCIPDDAFLQALETAVLRGVEVHLIVSDKADQILVGLAQRSFYEEMLDAGVKIHLYQRNFLHAKHMVIDDAITLVGSSNMDIRSFRLNSEISVLIYDAATAARLAAAHEQCFKHCRLLTVEEWNQRPLRVKVTQNVARLVDAIL